MIVEVTTPPPKQPDRKWKTEDMGFAVAKQRFVIPEVNGAVIFALFNTRESALRFVSAHPKHFGSFLTLITLSDGGETEYHWSDDADTWLREG
jgi:hypothetical protein